MTWSASSAESQNPPPPALPSTLRQINEALYSLVCVWGGEGGWGVEGYSCPWWAKATAEDEGGIRRDSCRHYITTHGTTAVWNNTLGALSLSRSLSPLHSLSISPSPLFSLIIHLIRNWQSSLRCCGGSDYWCPSCMGLSPGYAIVSFCVLFPCLSSLCNPKTNKIHEQGWLSLNNNKNN